MVIRHFEFGNTGRLSKSKNLQRVQINIYLFFRRTDRFNGVRTTTTCIVLSARKRFFGSEDECETVLFYSIREDVVCSKCLRIRFKMDWTVCIIRITSRPVPYHSKVRQITPTKSAGQRTGTWNQLTVYIFWSSFAKRISYGSNRNYCNKC
jgi:hypothetical protein